MERVEKILYTIIGFLQQNSNQLIIVFISVFIPFILKLGWNIIRRTKPDHIKINEDDPEERLVKAKKLLEKGNEDRAKQLFKSIILKMQDGNGSQVICSKAYVGIGKIWVSEGDIDEALEVADLCIESSNGKNGGAYIVRGMAFSLRKNEGDSDKAIEEYTKAMKHDLTITTDEAEPYRLRGLEYAFQKKYNQAIADYKKALKKKPNDAVVHRNLGDAYDDIGDLDEAIKEYNEAIKINPKYAGAYSDRGYVYDKKGAEKKALEDYNKAIKIDPKYATAFHNRGILYGNKGEFYRAFENLNKAVELDPKEVAHLSNRGFLYLMNGDMDKALADYTEAIKLDPQNAYAICLRGLIYSNDGDHDKAIEYCTKAIEVDSNDVAIFIVCGLAYLNKGEQEKAIKNFNMAIDLDPKMALAYNHRGIAFFNKGDYDEAIKDFCKTIEIDPKCAFAYSNRGYAHFNKPGYVYFNENNQNKALKNFSKDDLEKVIEHIHKDKVGNVLHDYNMAIKLNPKIALAYNNRGSLYYSTSKLDKAFLDFNEAIEIDPKIALAYNNRGNVYTSKGDQDMALKYHANITKVKGIYHASAIENYIKAIADYTKAIELDPNLALVYINRASVFNRIGETDKVISDCTIALEFDSKYSDAYYKRSDAYYSKGEKNQALDDYIKAMEINSSKAMIWSNRDPRFKNAYDNMINGCHEITESERDEDDFIAIISGTIRRNQADTESLVRRGIAYADRGDSYKAIDDFTKAINIQPNLLNALTERAKVYEKLGDYINAEKDFTTILYSAKMNIDDHSKMVMYKDCESKGFYGKAEDLLFELKENNNNKIINGIIRLFYKRLLKKGDSELLEGNLSREEILEEVIKL